jgi:hypothetical protein
MDLQEPFADGCAVSPEEQVESAVEVDDQDLEERPQAARFYIRITRRPYQESEPAEGDRVEGAWCQELRRAQSIERKLNISP